MKRLCAFIGIICLMLSAIAIRLRFCRLDVIIDGDYLAYSNNDTPVFFSISKGYERVELDREENVGSILQKLKAQIIKEEKVKPFGPSKRVGIKSCFVFLLMSVMRDVMLLMKF